MCGLWCRVNPIKLETGLRPNSAGIPYTLLLRMEAIGFPTLWGLLYRVVGFVLSSTYVKVLNIRTSLVVLATGGQAPKPSTLEPYTPKP